MLMRKLVYVVLLIILGGCISPSPSLEDIHQRVAKQVEVLIDSGYLLTTYIEIDEVFSTDSNSLYYIGESDSPGSDGAELPSRVIKYKERYLCFIELDEPEMSRTELFERGFVSDSNFHENLCLNRGRDWLLALRKYENGSTLVKKVISGTLVVFFWRYTPGENCIDGIDFARYYCSQFIYSGPF